MLVVVVEHERADAQRRGRLGGDGECRQRREQRVDEVVGGVHRGVAEVLDAAREGARYAGQPCSADGNALDCSGQTAACTYGTLPSTTQVQACVHRYLDASHIKGSTVTVTAPTYTVNGAPLVYTAVQVTVPFEMRYLPFTFNIRTQSEMRSETN